MLQITWVICSCVLIFIILIRIPQKDGSTQNFNLSSGFLGSPKKHRSNFTKFSLVFKFSFPSFVGCQSDISFLKYCVIYSFCDIFIVKCSSTRSRAVW